MKINEHTRISVLVGHHPDAIETLVSISPKFRKLRNPVLRKLLAKRATISMAAGIAGCSIESFFEKLKPLGFERKITAPGEKATETITAEPAITWNEAYERFKDHHRRIDVRALEMPGPMIAILKALEDLPRGEALYVQHKKFPLFLFPELNEKKFEYATHRISDSELHLLIYHPC